MIRVLFGTLVAVWVVVGCAMEEPDTGGVLVDPNYDVDIPEWLSIQDVDHNRDGTIVRQRYFPEDIN